MLFLIVLYCNYILCIYGAPEVGGEWISQLLQVAGLFSYSCSPCLDLLFDIINLRPWYLQVISDLLLNDNLLPLQLVSLLFQFLPS